MNFEDTVIKRLLAELSTFGWSNFSDPSTCTAMNSTTMMTLVDIQEDHPTFDAKVTFDYTPEASVEIMWWWTDVPSSERTFVIRFNPLRVDRNSKELIDAYNRAMSIL